jgi:hypothetical protein
MLLIVDHHAGGWAISSLGDPGGSVVGLDVSHSGLRDLQQGGD